MRLEDLQGKELVDHYVGFTGKGDDVALPHPLAWKRGMVWSSTPSAGVAKGRRC